MTGFVRTRRRLPAEREARMVASIERKAFVKAMTDRAAEMSPETKKRSGQKAAITKRTKRIPVTLPKVGP